MNKPLVIFGIGKICDVVWSVFQDRSQFKTVAFAVDDSFVPDSGKHRGLPVVSKGNLVSEYPPEHFDVFVAIGYQGLNRIRRDCYQSMLSLGYRLPSFVDPAYSKYAINRLGQNCFVMGESSIQYGLSMGDDNFIWSGSIVGHHSTMGSHNWITSGSGIAGCVTVGDQNFFGMGCTVSDNVKIGDRNFLGSNSFISKSIENDSVFASKMSEKVAMNSEKFVKVFGY